MFLCLFMYFIQKSECVKTFEIKLMEIILGESTKCARIFLKLKDLLCEGFAYSETHDSEYASSIAKI